MSVYYLHRPKLNDGEKSATETVQPDPLANAVIKIEEAVEDPLRTEEVAIKIEVEIEPESVVDTN